MAVHPARSGNYLLVRSDAMHLLLDCAGILEIVEIEALASSRRGFYDWRDQVLGGVAVAEFFRVGRQPGRLGIAYSPADDQPPVMLRVCEVLWLREISRSAWIPVPSLPPDSARYFDAVVPVDEGRQQAYRLRRPLFPKAFENLQDPSPEALEGLEGPDITPAGLDR